MKMFINIFFSALLIGPVISNVSPCSGDACLKVKGVGMLTGSKMLSSKTSRQFFGYWAIPYGEDTGGENRFLPPIKADRLNDGKTKSYDATQISYMLNCLKRVCPQSGISLEGSAAYTFEKMGLLNRSDIDESDFFVSGTEDCLHLSVFTPKTSSEVIEAKNDGKLLPVMFFIHGGAFMSGTYVGHGVEHLMEHDVIVVEFQYRVGPLGFLCVDHPDAAGNMGMLDQELALRWTIDHVKDFGGDPDQITIFGESAGAASVSFHLLSPMSKTRFNRAIAQSGAATSPWAIDEDPEGHAKAIANRLGCPTDNLRQMIRCLKDKPLLDIIQSHKSYVSEERAQGEMGLGGSIPCIQTTGDQVFINKHPIEYLQSGDFTPKDVLFGANKHEGSYVVALLYKDYVNVHGLEHDEHFLRHKFIPLMLGAMGLKDKSGVVFEILEYDYFNYTDFGNWDKMIPGMINMMGSFFLKAATYEFMKFNSIYGGNSRFYSFEHEGEHSLLDFVFEASGTKPPPVPHGVGHADDLIYLFYNPIFPLNEMDSIISQNMAKMWANFAIYGDPNPEDNPVDGIPKFPLWKEEDPKFLRFDLQSTIEAEYIKTWKCPDRDGCLSGK